MSKLVRASELQQSLTAKEPAVLLHVLPEEHFQQRHIAGAKNACIYEMAFLDQVRELAPDTTTPIVVYGEGAPSLDSEVAAARLTSAGYSNVADFRGGLREWIAAGLPVEGTGNEVLPKTPNGRFIINIEKSVVRWTGRNLFNHHEGTVRLSSGSLTIADNVLTQAEFVLDMRSIACSDLTDSAWNNMLLKHLATDDFFATDAHPTARFVAERTEAIPGCTPGTPNHKIDGQFTLRGITKPLSFPAVIAQEDDDHLTGQAELDLDRTQFGSIYGSGKFFAALGKHVVNDLIHLHLKVYAERAA
jgi:polyisoprenoid-binding protein YceI/rhodanese-related sulfurtransferase